MSLKSEHEQQLKDGGARACIQGPLLSGGLNGELTTSQDIQYLAKIFSSTCGINFSLVDLWHTLNYLVEQQPNEASDSLLVARQLAFDAAFDWSK